MVVSAKTYVTLSDVVLGQFVMLENVYVLLALLAIQVT